MLAPNSLPSAVPASTSEVWPRCDVLIPFGATGEDAELCGAHATEFCEFCGPRCESCWNEFPCCENGGVHTVTDRGTFYRPARFRKTHMTLGGAACIAIDRITAIFGGAK